MDLQEIMTIIMQVIQKLGANWSPEDRANVQKILVEVFQSGSTPAKAMKFPKDQLELMYSYAVNLYEGGKYDEARKGFVHLYRINPEDTRFAFGSAACFHKLKQYQKAIEYYLIVGRIDKTDPTPWAHAGDCYIHLGRSDLACIMLDKAVTACGDQQQHAALKKQAELILETLQKQIGGLPGQKTNENEANVSGSVENV